MIFRLRLLLVILFLWPANVFAAGQDVQQQPVYERVPKGYEAPGIRLGDIMLHPSAELLEVFNSNIYATQSNRKDDFITNISPALKAETLNKDRGFQADLGIDNYLYSQFNREDYTDAHIDLKTYAQVSKASKLNGELQFQTLHEARTSEAASNNIGAEEPVHYLQSMGRIGWDYKPGKIGVETFLQHENLSFDNVKTMGGGPELVNKDRNRDEDSASVKLSCDLADKNQVYTKLSGFTHNYEHRDYETATGSYTGVKRNSKGGDLRIGYAFDLPHLVKLDTNAGYYHQDFQDSRLDNVTTGVGRADATWLLTPLTTVDFSAARDVFETIQPDASAFAQNNFGAKVTHELRRNILLGFELDAGRNNYIGSSRKDRYWGAGPSLTYRMNRNIDWKAEYMFDRRDSNQPDLDYNRQRVFVGLQVKF